MSGRTSLGSDFTSSRPRTRRATRALHSLVTVSAPVPRCPAAPCSASDPNRTCLASTTSSRRRKWCLAFASSRPKRRYPASASTPTDRYVNQRHLISTAAPIRSVPSIDHAWAPTPSCPLAMECFHLILPLLAGSTATSAPCRWLTQRQPGRTACPPLSLHHQFHHLPVRRPSPAPQRLVCHSM